MTGLWSTCRGASRFGGGDTPPTLRVNGRGEFSVRGGRDAPEFYGALWIDVSNRQCHGSRSCPHPDFVATSGGSPSIETIVAAVVLTVALVALAELLAVSVRMHQIGRDSASAARLAQDKFEEMMKMNFNTNPAIAGRRESGRERGEPFRRAGQFRLHAPLGRRRRTGRQPAAAPRHRAPGGRRAGRRALRGDPGGPVMVIAPLPPRRPDPPDGSGLLARRAAGRDGRVDPRRGRCRADGHADAIQLSRAARGGGGAAGGPLRPAVDRALPPCRRQQPVSRRRPPPARSPARRSRPSGSIPTATGRTTTSACRPTRTPPTGFSEGWPAPATRPNEDVTISFDAGNNAITLQDNVTGTTVTRTDAIVTGLQFVYRNPSRVITTNPERRGVHRNAAAGSDEGRGPEPRGTVRPDRELGSTSEGAMTKRVMSQRRCRPASGALRSFRRC